MTTEHKAALPEVQRTAPERIYLTVSDNAYDANEPFPADYGEELCWSQDAPIAVCVPYVRADLAAPCVAPEAVRGYVFLRDGELLREGDEVIHNGFNEWRAVPESFVGTPYNDGMKSVRRALTAAPEGRDAGRCSGFVECSAICEHGFPQTVGCNPGKVTSYAPPHCLNEDAISAGHKPRTLAAAPASGGAQDALPGMPVEDVNVIEAAVMAYHGQDWPFMRIEDRMDARIRMRRASKHFATPADDAGKDAESLPDFLERVATELEQRDTLEKLEQKMRERANVLTEKGWLVAADLREFADTIAALRQQQGREWRPIESAPTGETVLLAYRFGLGCAIGHKDEDGVWHGHEGANWGSGAARFSHWKPEPQPPEEG